MQTGFQEQVPTTKSRIQVCLSPHTSRNMQWKLAYTGKNHTTIFRLKERVTGPVYPWLNGTWFSFMNPDLIYSCNTEFMTCLAGICIWLDWISTVSICFSSPFSQQKNTSDTQAKQRWQKYSRPFCSERFDKKSTPRNFSVLHVLPVKRK